MTTTRRACIHRRMTCGCISPDSPPESFWRPEQILGLLPFDSPQEKDLAAGQPSGEQFDVGARHGEEVCKKRNDGLVGAAFERRSVHGDFQLSGGAFAIDAGDGGLLRAGLGADGEGDAGRGFADHALSSDSAGAGFLRGPKSAVPMRMRVAPSSMAMGKSPLIPMERTWSERRGWAAAQRSRH